MKSIETREGLLAAIWDVICDEMPEYFPVAAILERLPYGQRVRDIMVQLTREGVIENTRRGWYRHLNA